MKLYRHYKGQSYKYLGLARHSETLDEMVIYETLYDNPRGRTWVRPKDMFFGPVDVQGFKGPRFLELPLELRETTEVDQEQVAIVASISEQAFGEWDRNWFYSTFNKYRKFHLVTAYIEDCAVGFKLGYERNQWEFYSWLGAVVPESRGLGVASELMRAQHEWCKKQGYRSVQTKTKNRFRSMLLLNIRHGFEVIGTHTSEDGELKILLEKKL